MIIPITLIVIVGLFWAQSKGTATVGALFGPIMLLWFGSLAALGLNSIIQYPDILNGLNPVYAIHFLQASPWIAFVALGAALC
jgi:KUP system potassium uptake protein